ncbi:hypothetical protein SAMN02746000_02944, partial [Paracoccus sp. J56]
MTHSGWLSKDAFWKLTCRYFFLVCLLPDQIKPI